MFRFNTLRFRQEPDVNSVAGFTEALATATGRELSPEELAAIQATPDRDVRGGLTTESPDPPPVGEAPEEPEPVAEEEVEGAAPPETEEGEQSPSGFEQGYLKALGEQSDKLAEERVKREALEAKVAALEKEDEEPEFYAPDAETLEQLEEVLDERGGAFMMNSVASSQPQNIPAALAVWKASGDPQAYLYEDEVNRLMAQGRESAQPAAPQLPPELEGLAQRERLNTTFRQLAAELGERGPQLAPHVDAALAEAGPFVQQAITASLSSNDPAEHKRAFEEVVRLAEARLKTSRVEDTKTDLSRKTKQAAGVNRGSQAPVSRGQSAGGDLPKSQAEFEELGEDEKKAVATRLVADQFAKTETTSVRAGLTYGTKP